MWDAILFLRKMTRKHPLFYLLSITQYERECIGRGVD